MKLHDGVIRFNLIFQLEKPVETENLRRMNAWRHILYKLGLIGRNPSRYDGRGFGNISIRMESEGSFNSFAISGTQTGGLSLLTSEHYTLVKDFDLLSNTVISQGPVKPSSESLTHGILYSLDRSLSSVIHIHSPEIWNKSSLLGIPATSSDVSCGTSEMAKEVCSLFSQPGFKNTGIFSMGGHKDGIIAFGESVEQAGITIIRYMALASD